MRAFGLPFTAPLADYQREAEELHNALKSGDMSARWKFKWMHARYRGKSVSEVEPQALDLADAQIVVAREYAFRKWDYLAKFAQTVYDGDALGWAEHCQRPTIADWLRERGSRA